MTLSLALTDAAIKAAHKAKKSQLTDGRGLYLKLMPSGLHSWRFDFRSPVTAKRGTLYIGTYPDVSLKGARDAAHEARQQIANGVCPLGQRDIAREAVQAAQERAARIAKGEAAPGTFKAVALEFWASKWQAEPKAGFVNKWGDGHGKKWKSFMDRYAFPVFGDEQCSDITAERIMDLFTAIERKGFPQVAYAMRGYISQVFALARVKRLCPFNPAVDLKYVLPEPPKSVPFMSQTTVTGACKVIGAIDAWHIESHKEALQLLALIWQRPANVLGMKWDWLDLEGGQMDWQAMGLDMEFSAPCLVIPAAEMKRRVNDKMNGKPHIVPLPSQAVALLKARREKVSADSSWVFPAKFGAGGCLDDSCVTDSLHGMGLKGIMTMHGFRAMARTMLREVHKVSADVLEAHLAHSNGLATGVSYDRATHLEERTQAVQTWGDYLDKLRNGNVIPMSRAA